MPFRWLSAITYQVTADGLHVSQGNRLGLVLSQHDPWWLQSLHHCLETLHQHGNQWCNRYIGTSPTGFRLWSSQCSASSQTAIWQRPQLHLWRTGWVVEREWHGSCSRSTIPSADAGQDCLSALRATPAGQRRRWHQTLKNRILLENYFLPGDLKGQIGKFISHYNHRRYHESLQNLTPADVYFGRGETILQQRERIKQNTINERRLQYRKHAA